MPLTAAQGANDVDASVWIFLILRRARSGGCPTYRIAVNADAFASGEHDETAGRSAARGASYPTSQVGSHG